MSDHGVAPFCQSLAERIRFARQIAGLTQREAAAAIGVRVARLRALESGTATISADMLLRIAVAVDAPVGWLYGEADDDHWPETALATLLRDPELPALVASFSRITDPRARALVMTLADGLADLDYQPPPRRLRIAAPPVPDHRR